MVSFEEFRDWCYDAYPEIGFYYKSKTIVAIGFDHDCIDIFCKKSLKGTYSDTFKSSRYRGNSFLDTNEELRKLCEKAWGRPLIPWKFYEEDPDIIRLFKYITNNNFKIQIINSRRTLLLSDLVDVAITEHRITILSRKFLPTDLQGIECYLRELKDSDKKTILL